jgi:hypothetical protein
MPLAQRECRSPQRKAADAVWGRPCWYFHVRPWIDQPFVTSPMSTLRTDCIGDQGDLRIAEKKFSGTRNAHFPVDEKRRASTHGLLPGQHTRLESENAISPTF